jgi:hypothetical protein
MSLTKVFELHARILCRFRGLQQWFPGTICQVYDQCDQQNKLNNALTAHKSLPAVVYDITYDDGVVERSVEPSRVRSYMACETASFVGGGLTETQSFEHNLTAWTSSLSDINQLGRQQSWAAVRKHCYYQQVEQTLTSKDLEKINILSKEIHQKYASVNDLNPKLLRSLLNILNEHDVQQIFYGPSYRGALFYSDIVPIPIHSSAILKRLRKGTYTSFQMACCEVILMFRNAQRYNDSQTALYKTATRLLALFCCILARALRHTMTQSAIKGFTDGCEVKNALLERDAIHGCIKSKPKHRLLCSAPTPFVLPHKSWDGWRKSPYTLRPYKCIHTYESPSADSPAVGSSTILHHIYRVLRCNKSTYCDGNCCNPTIQNIGSYDALQEKFMSPCRCRSQNMMCGPECGCANQECMNSVKTLKVGHLPYAAIQVKQIEPAFDLDSLRKMTFSDAMREIKKSSSNKSTNTDNLSNKFHVDYDVALVNTWGIDTFVRTNLEFALRKGDDFGILTQHQRLQTIKRLLFHVNQVPAHQATDIRNAIKLLQKRASCDSDAVTMYALNKLSNCIDHEGLDCFRIHPKGQGAVCMRSSGIGRGTIIAKYFGHVYAPWEWFWKQDAIKQLQKRLGSVNGTGVDFYNIVLERPCDDVQGYDVLFVDPSSFGNFSSRFSHSCDPNCATKVMGQSQGQYSVVMFALRDIVPGEELTFDYNSVTESQEEYQSAVCLCGAASCRGSFLFYANSRAFKYFTEECHTTLERVRILLDACHIASTSQSLSQSDRNILLKYGFKSSLLSMGNACDNAISQELNCPLWLKVYDKF